MSVPEMQNSTMKKTLKLVVVSARGLKNVHHISNMNPFTTVSVVGLGLLNNNRPNLIRTPTNHNGGRNPVWSFYSEFELPESELQQNRFTLVFQICSEGRMFGNRDIGKVVVPMKELLDLDSRRDSGMPLVMTTLPVTTSSGKYQGDLTFSYEFSDTPTPAPSSTIENGVDIHAPTIPAEKNANFLVSCITEFFARVCGTVVGDVLSDLVL